MPPAMSTGAAALSEDDIANGCVLGMLSSCGQFGVKGLEGLGFASIFVPASPSRRQM